MELAPSTQTRLVGGAVVTLDEHDRVIEDGEVSWDAQGVIDYVGPSRGPLRRQDIDARDTVVTPGLVNGHTHSGMTAMRGLADSGTLQVWLSGVRDVELQMTHQDIRDGLALALVEMLRSGTTAFADMYLWDSDLLALVARSGLRVLAAPAMFGYDGVAYPQASPADGRATLALTEELASQFAGDRQIRLAFGPHAPYTCPPDHLRDVARRAQRLGVPVHIHLSETAGEVSASLAEHGLTPIAHVDRLGLFDGPAHVAHAVHATADDITLLARRGASVAHNPISNLKLGAGVAPMARMRDAGVRVCLGTDSVASNNTLDLFEELKVTAIIHRGLAQQPDLVGASEVLRMATGAAAAAIGFPETGTLAPGKWADVVAVRADTARATPLHSAQSFLVFGACGADVRHVVIGGRHVVADEVVTTLDEHEARRRLTASARRLTGHG